jgi:putative ABC transport system ATP-binding protein
MNNVIELSEIHKTYILGKVEVPALKSVNLNFQEGEFSTLSGPSGSGKTTLLNLVGLIDIPTSGFIKLEGKTVGYNGLSKLHRVRLSKIGFIFQSFNLIPVLDAYENIEYPLLLTNMTNQERQKRVEQLLDEVGLTPYKNHKPNELSGGQRQRVAIARALVNYPKIVLADEPTANLDSQTAKDILELMVKLNKEEQVTFIFSTHDPQVVKMAKKIIKLQDGRVEMIQD